jgi:ABC-type glutathione transport system ATPase component
VRDLSRLAELSHTLDRVALALCRDDPDDRRIEVYLEELAEGEREAVAIARSYALRRRELEGPEPVNERAAAALAGVVRRMKPAI